MKVRYYLRGLGLGILITAVFFLLGDNSKQTMSDEMIKQRAKELGMVESSVLADIGDSMEETEEESSQEDTMVEEIASVEDITSEENVSEEITESSQEEAEQTDTEENVEVEETETSDKIQEEIVSEETDAEEESKESVPAGEMISIVVNKGEGSDTVSQRLYEAGLVDDAYAYDRYLMQNGYDKRIAAGEHMIPMGAEWQEIAKILTS